MPFNLEPAGVATVPFDSAVAEGRITIHFRGLPSTAKAVFEGKQRQCFAAVQARFKRPVAFRDLVAGTEFRRALRLPQSRIVNAAAAWIAAKVSMRGLKLLLACDTPFGPRTLPSPCFPTVQPAPCEAFALLTTLEQC